MASDDIQEVDLLIKHGVVITIDAKRRIFADGAIASHQLEGSALQGQPVLEGEKVVGLRPHRLREVPDRDSSFAGFPRQTSRCLQVGVLFQIVVPSVYWNRLQDGTIEQKEELVLLAYARQIPEPPVPLWNQKFDQYVSDRLLRHKNRYAWE